MILPKMISEVISEFEELEIPRDTVFEELQGNSSANFDRVSFLSRLFSILKFRVSAKFSNICRNNNHKSRIFES